MAPLAAGSQRFPQGVPPAAPNFQLVADELETRLGFKRHRESVAAFARTHFPHLLCQPEPRAQSPPPLGTLPP